MRTDDTTQVHAPRQEFINGRWHENTGKFGVIERISCFRVCIAGSIVGALGFVATSGCSALVQIAFTISGIYGGMHMGKECTVKEKGFIIRKTPTMNEFRKCIENSEIEQQAERDGYQKISNVFKWIWP